MAVTPVLQNINAFDVSEGTTIYFSVSGATEFIRSSVVTFRDIELDIDVATNTYSTTQLFNIIPPNLEGIENGKQYAVRIDVYSQVSPEGHESMGTSVAKPVWCLPSPTLEFTSPSGEVGQDVTVIETSSYVFDALFEMYDDESLLSDVTNRIQSYKFDLYNGTIGVSSLVETTGFIYGTGTPVSGNPLQYTLQHAFNGLGNNNSYYAIVTIITEHGMEIQSISSYILPQLGDITFNVANVKNNSCDGYIEVQSNITNITGYTNASYEIGDDIIDLTSPGDFVVWGYNPNTGEEEYSISFSNTNWSLLLSAKNLIPSISSPNIGIDNTHLLKMGDYENTSVLYAYARQDDDNNMWIELYVIDANNMNSMSFIQSNVLNNVTSSTLIYILLNCVNGCYSIQLSTTLGD